MAYQTKLGIVINHFKRIEEIEYLKALKSTDYDEHSAHFLKDMKLEKFDSDKRRAQKYKDRSVIRIIPFYQSILKN